MAISLPRNKKIEDLEVNFQKGGFSLGNDKKIYHWEKPTPGGVLSPPPMQKSNVNPYNNFFKGTGDGGINVFADLGNFTETEVVKPAVEAVKTLWDQTQAGIAAQRSGAGAGFGSKEAEQLKSQYAEDFRQGRINRQQFNEQAQKIDSRAARTEAAYDTAEKETGTRFDRDKGATAALETAGNLYGTGALFSWAGRTGINAGKAGLNTGKNVIDKGAEVVSKIRPGAPKAPAEVIEEAAVELAGGGKINVSGMPKARPTVQAAPEFRIDDTLQVSNDIARRLETNGITSVNRRDNPYGIEYDPNTRSINVRDRDFATASNFDHELGHHIFATKITPQERKIFEGAKGQASRQTKGRKGYDADDYASEDFAEMYRHAVNSGIDAVPGKYRSVIGKFVTTANEVAQETGRAPQEVAEAMLQPMQQKQRPQVTPKAPEVQAGTPEAPTISSATDMPDAGVDQQMLQAIQLAQRPKVNPANKQAAPIVEQGNDLPVSEQMRREQEARYHVNPVRKVVNTLARQLYDPRHVEQRLDNAEFARRKAGGAIRRGQKTLEPTESLADLRGRIQHPVRMADTKLKEKYKTDAGDFSVHDVIKAYGKEKGKKAQAFENYRLFKDELWRMANQEGHRNSLPDAPEAMARYVQEYEAYNPRAIAHNSALRQHALREVAEKERVGTEAQDTTEALAKNPFYTPRKVASPEDAERIKTSGGIRSAQKGIKAREEYNEAPTSSLSLFRNNAIEHESDIASQLYGTELRRRVQQGGPEMSKFKDVLNADTVIEHKALQQTAREIAKDIQTAKRLRNQVADSRKSVKGKSEAAARQAVAAEDKVVDSMKRLISKAKGNRDDVLNDIADRDPRYADELAQIEAQDLSHLTKREAREQIRYDKQQLDAKYPEPNGLSREEYLKLADTMGAYVKSLDNATGQRFVKQKMSQRMNEEFDALTGMLNQSRDDLKGLVERQGETNSQFRDTTQNVSQNTQAVQYRVNGEIGKIEVSGELAKNISKQEERVIQGLIDKAIRPISNAQKIVWTGLLRPSFQVVNTFVKNPNLMFYNADGLSGVRPAVATSFVEQILRTNKMKTFKSEITKRGASFENPFQTKTISSDITDDIARRANVGTFIAGHFTSPVRTLGDYWKGANAALAAIPNAQRTSVAYGAYKRARGLGFNHDEALDIAAQAPAKVFGDFDRVSQLAQALEAVIPYSGATQAGTRAVVQATKRKPVESAVKATVMLTAGAGIASYSISNAGGYYDDMIKQGKEYLLDGSITIALPGASKDESTGEWTGIIHVPIAPDFRPTNRALWRTVYDLDRKQAEVGKTGGRIAGEIFNQLTGDMSSNLYDTKKGEKDPINGVLPSSPLVNIGKTFAGNNIYDGSDLADEYTATRPRTDQITEGKTSQAAIDASKMTKLPGGDAVFTPQQIDQLLGMASDTGDIIQKPDEAGTTFLGSFTKPFKPGTSLTTDKKEGAEWYKDTEKVGKSIQDEKTFREFMADKAKGTEESKADLLKNAKKVQKYFSISDGKFKTTDLFRAEKYYDQLQRQKGKEGNPLFDLEDKQLQKVLEYRSSKMLNQGKQSYDKNGNPLFVSLGLDEKWYQEYQDKESKYWGGIKKELKDKVARTSGEAKTQAQKALDNLSNDDPKTFSGAKKAELSKEQQKAMDYYFTLPSGTGDRSAFIKANPWLVAYWDASDGFNKKERDVLALKTEEQEEFGSSSDSGGYGGKGGYRRRGGGGGSSERAFNERQYAIGVNAGGEIARPKVTARGGSGDRRKRYGERKRRSLPKVTSKKSLV